MDNDIISEIKASGAERVLFTQDVLWLDTHSPHVKTFTIDDARRMILSEIVADWTSLPLNVRINLPVDGINGVVLNQVFDILRFSSMMDIQIQDAYWMSPQEYIAISDVEPLLGEAISDLMKNDIANFPGNDIAVISKVTDVVSSLPVLVEPKYWFDTSKGDPYHDHHPKKRETSFAVGGSNRMHQFDRIWQIIGVHPPIILAPQILGANRHLMDNKFVGESHTIHYDMLIDAMGVNALRDFLVATIKSPTDPISVVGDHLTPLDLSNGDYVWSWSNWYDYVRWCLNNVS